MDLSIIISIFKFPFISFGIIGGMLFYVFVLYMNIGILVFNKTMLELITFGILKDRTLKPKGVRR